MLEVLSEIKAIDLAAGGFFVLTGLLLMVAYLPMPLWVRRWSVILSLVSIAGTMRLMMMSATGQMLSLETVLPFL